MEEVRVCTGETVHRGRNRTRVLFRKPDQPRHDSVVDDSRYRSLNVRAVGPLVSARSGGLAIRILDGAKKHPAESRGAMQRLAAARRSNCLSSLACPKPREVTTELNARGHFRGRQVCCAESS